MIDFQNLVLMYLSLYVLVFDLFFIAVIVILDFIIWTIMFYWTFENEINCPKF